MASAMGVARIPTQGSWRPLVSTVVGLPYLVDGAARDTNARGGLDADRHHDILAALRCRQECHRHDSRENRPA